MATGATGTARWLLQLTAVGRTTGALPSTNVLQRGFSWGHQAHYVPAIDLAVTAVNPKLLALATRIPPARTPFCLDLALDFYHA